MRASLRSVLPMLGLLAACSTNPPATGALRVEVELDASLQSRCLKVTATDGVVTRETDAIPLAGQRSPLVIAVLPQGMLASVTVQAIGYADAACTQLTVPAEQSDATEGLFAVPFGVVTLTLAPVRPDGGVDAGADAGVDAGVDGGTDAGLDGGVDNDNDGWPADEDCDDTRPEVNPGMVELCGDGLDNDCNGFIDCQDRPHCDGMPCLDGTCGGGTCRQPVETMCNDGVDNDDNGLTDCEDPSCVGLLCDDGTACTSGERCAPNDGGCQPGITEVCDAPQLCRVNPGVCNPADGTCSYTPLNTGTCDDSNACTTMDRCSNGVCTGDPVACPTRTCFAAGQCQNALDGGCTYTPLDAGSTCNDGDNCTTGDTCDGNGGCTGAFDGCHPTPCQSWGGTCTSNGACIFGDVIGPECDAGVGVPGTCIAGGVCQPVPANALFPFTPSNFAEAQLPDAGAVFTIGTSITLDTDTVTTTPGMTLPPSTVIDGGQPVLLFRIDTLTVNNNVVVTVEGSRPVIFAVTGNATISNGGALIVRAGAGHPTCGNGGNGTASGGCESGGGGGGFGSPGARGGACGGQSGDAGVANGGETLVPLRGGCRGGNVTPTNTPGGAGGGAVQLTVAGTLTVNGRIGAPGRGGAGAPSGDNGGGGAGSGGGVLLEADVLQLQGNARITANGGGGGEGSRGQSGNPGQDGRTMDEAVAAGGINGSASGGNGGAGAVRMTGAVSGSAGTSGAGAGGGGGGVGRIRFNVKTTCTRAGSAVVSPALSNGGAATCM